MDKDIVLKKEGAVLTVWLNRPLSHNALTPEMVLGLTAVFQDVNDRDDIRVVILSGNGSSFCAGADLSFMQAAADYSFDDNVSDGETIFDLMQAIDSCRKPVVGRVNGAAIGGGVGLVSCCDSVVAVERAKFAFSEVRLGILPAVISPFVIAKIGPANGRELFLTGERFSAEQAKQIGLVQHVVSEDSLEEKVAERVEGLLQGAPGAQAAGKELIRVVAFQEKTAVRDYTSNLIAQRRASAEGKEGMSSFLEKRKPRWQEE